MRTLYLLTMIYLVLTMTGCMSSVMSQSQPVVKQPPTQTAEANLIKDPVTVAIYQKNQKPYHRYKVVGKGMVSKFNTGGIRRQEAIIKDLLRAQAAQLGGDAIIDVAHDQNFVKGTVISYG